MLPPRRTDRADPALDALWVCERPIADSASPLVEVVDVVLLCVVSRLAEHLCVGLVRARLAVTLPQDDPAGVLDEPETLIAGLIVRASKQCHNPLAGSELGIRWLGSDLEGAVIARRGIPHGDATVVSRNVEMMLDVSGGNCHRSLLQAELPILL